MEHISWSIENSIGFLVLANPPGNVMTHAFFLEFNQLINQLESFQLSGIIIEAQGRHFSSGTNIDELISFYKQNHSSVPPEIENNRQAFLKLGYLQIPTIACISGICYGSALELALCAHFRIATEKALLCLPESSFGLMPGLGGIFNSVKCWGKAKTLEMALTGNSIKGEQAQKDGLIDFISPKENLRETALLLLNSLPTPYKKELKPIYTHQFNKLNEQRRG